MYKEEDRLALLDRMMTFVKDNQEFVCLVQIGSGAAGFADIYSDIDLMAGCVGAASVQAAGEKFCGFFAELPASEIPIMSKQWCLLWSSVDGLEAELVRKTEALETDDGLNHHRFFFTIRKTEIAILRGNCIYAEMMLSDARQMLLRMEAAAEGKKVHEFKAYHTLNGNFLWDLQATYPAEMSRAALIGAKDALLSLYVRTVEQNALPGIEPSQFQIINCFE